MSYQVAGTLHEIQPEQQVSPTFRKRSFVLVHAENPNYPQYIPFECTQQRCELLDGYQVGDAVEVQFNLKGREWLSPKGEKKYFLSLEAWRVQRQGTAPSQPPAAGASFPTDAELDAYNADDLPF
ncbi:MAG: DUF3127 domain-containing protein [Bacteroidia bacterium]|nr:DUF3127 domain-containing protein [Bacteroidia bacterium]